jgi:hypothetical protein
MTTLDENSVRAVPVPVAGFDPKISLATAVHAAPGVYALLVGSGISSAAGIPTGWQIVSDLVQRAAAAAGAEPGSDFDAEVWWDANGVGDLGYSQLLDTLASTPAARAALVDGYFLADDDEREEGRKLPTAAHEAIADLVARGAVKVILTTNFDRLLERALESKGIQPQVIHRVEQIAAMTPLAHSRVTIIKLHGDYADLDKRNTVDELSTYPTELDELLRRVLDEYGLIVSGWSGEWDVALAHAVEETKARRYPLFWASYAAPSENAARLVAGIGGVRLDDCPADELFTGLREGLEGLDKLASPPLSRELAVARLKRYLPDPVRRIDLHDLVFDEVKRVESLIGDPKRFPYDLGVTGGQAFAERFDEVLQQARADMDTLLHLLAAGAYYGSDHVDLWVAVIDRLMALRGEPGGTFQDVLAAAHHYPALLALIVMLALGSDELAGPVLLRPKYRARTENKEESACVTLHPWKVLANEATKHLPRWGAQIGRYLYPESRLLRADLEALLAGYEPDATRRADLFNRAEFLLALSEVSVYGDRAFPGEYVLPLKYADSLPVEDKMRRSIVDDRGPLLDGLFSGDVGAATVLSIVFTRRHRKLRADTGNGLVCVGARGPVHHS